MMTIVIKLAVTGSQAGLHQPSETERACESVESCELPSSGYCSLIDEVFTDLRGS